MPLPLPARPAISRRDLTEIKALAAELREKGKRAEK
jgi:hypothetical protein